MEEQGQFITARLLQEKFFGQDQAPEVVCTLIQTIQEHNDQCRELVGKDYALITVPKNVPKFSLGHKKRSTAVLQPLLTLNLIL